MKVAVLFKAEDTFSYAYQLGNKPFISQIMIENKGTEKTEPMCLRLTSNPSFFKDYVIEEVPQINPKDTYTIKNIELEYDIGILANITEEMKDVICCKLFLGDECVAEAEQEIKVMAYDEVSNWEKDLKAFASFVMPNHAEIDNLITLVANKKGERYGEYSILGYVKDKEEVIRTARCTYEVIQEQEIIYVLMKQGFHSGWQRIRMIDEILKEKQGNCLDLTLFFASLFEAESLNPVIVIISGHAFVGFWTKDQHFSQGLYTDPETIYEMLMENRQNLVLLECTLARKNANTDFDYATQVTYEKHVKPENMVALIDVKAARKEGVLPIPSRLREVDEEKEEPFYYPPVDEEEKVQESEELEEDEWDEIEIDEIIPLQAADKFVRWKNKLLDLTASSDLLNMKVTSEGKRAACLPGVDVAQLYDKVKRGMLFTVIGEEADKAKIKTDLEQKVLHTNYSNQATDKLLNALNNKDAEYRNQKGASILYLTLGCVQWKDEKTGKSYQAPILMIPMVFKKEAKVLKMYYAGAEIRVNEAVLEMLKERFSIQVPAVIPEPLDADGKPNMKAIFQKLNVAFKEKNDLNVVESAHIGVFAFAQYMMWNDLDKNEQFCLEHPLIQSIKQGEKSGAIGADKIEFDEDELFLPIAADGAQMKAMAAALGNQSFVLHGPPGTGKSQTITGMLANFIGHDHTVLFAAEKAAALQVVYERMKSIGLDLFCLYLPVDSTSRSAKEQFLSQYKQLMETAETEPTKYEVLSKQIQKEKNKLQEQLAIFDSMQYGGYTLKELIENVLKNPECFVSADLVGDQVNKEIGQGNLKQLENLLKDTMRMRDAAGDVKGHPLSQWGAFEYKFGMQMDLRVKLRKYQEILEKAEKGYAEFDNSAWNDDEKLKYMTDLEACQSLINALKIPESIRTMEQLNKKLANWIQWIEVQGQIEALSKEIDPEVAKLDLERMSNKWKMLMSAKTYESSYEKLVMKKALSKYIHRENISERCVTEMFEKALKLKQLNEYSSKAINASFPLNKNESLSLKKFLDKYFPEGIPEVLKDFSEGDKKRLEQMADLLKEKYVLEEQIDTLLGKDVFPWNLGNRFAEKQELIEQQLAGLNTLRQWSDYQKLKKCCVEKGLAPWVALYEEGKEKEAVLADFLAYSCKRMLKKVYETQEIVKEFAGFRFEQQVEKFAELMDSFYEVCAAEIKYRHLKKIQKLMSDGIYEKEKVALKKIIEANGKGITIREIIQAVGTFILKLTPCVMATPMTVSMYFPPRAVQFEHMILDEASQLKTCKAIGLVARSKHSIVVGDPNQMPPTSFFEGSRDEKLGVLEEDQESILKECIALDLPDYYLRWHYRSHHESLITFSNHKYYGRKMITFPAADKISRVRVVKTKGIYDRGNTMTNPLEAETLVVYMEEMIAGGDSRSFGVIAFNKRQQTLLEQLVEEHAEKNPKFACGLEKMKEKGEPLFIRNLESVQGDERDVILFSVGFGPDKDGKLVMAFGPLAKAGGWRRLNVAITRARDEMILFTSLHAKQMSLSETASKGVKDLKEFLVFAEGEEIFKDDAEENAEYKVDGFSETICKYLEEAGYQYDVNVGSSALKVDVAVYDKKKDHYLLGILLNNKNTNTDFSIYDSEIGQNRILKKQGWNLLRIWSLDWLEDSEREKNRILNYLEKVTNQMEEN